VALTLNFDTVDEARRIFERLSVGGTVTMPINEAFWAKAFGMLTDRFGCPWVVNGEMKPM
jgi:PhnB protein